MDASASGATRLRCVGYCRCFAMANLTAQTTSALIYRPVRTRASGTTSSWWWFSWFSLWYFTWCDRRPCADETIWTRRCRRPTMAPTTDHPHRPSTDAFATKSSVVFVPLKIVINFFTKVILPWSITTRMLYVINVQCLFCNSHVWQQTEPSKNCRTLSQTRRTSESVFHSYCLLIKEMMCLNRKVTPNFAIDYIAICYSMVH